MGFSVSVPIPLSICDRQFVGLDHALELDDDNINMLPMIMAEQFGGFILFRLSLLWDRPHI